MEFDLYITQIMKTEMGVSNLKIPRKRYLDYYQDLHSLYKNNLSAETFYQGGQFSFSEICDRLLEQSKDTTFFKNLEILIPTYWVNEFDSDYTSCGPYLHEKAHLNCDLFDIYNHGTLAGLVGIHVLQRYLMCGQYNKGMVLALEQTTVPRNTNEHHVMPTKNGACALVIECFNSVKRLKATTPNLSLKLIASHIFDSSLLHFSMKNSLDVILELLQKTSFSRSKICVVTKRNSLVWKQIHNAILLDNGLIPVNYSFEHVPPDPTILSIFSYLENVMNNKNRLQYDYLIIIEEDVESLNVGVLILEVIKS